MTRLAFDIYPPPVTGLGTRLVRLTNQHYAGGTTYIHGRPMGQGTIVVEKGNSWVTATNFAVGNYVIVRDLDISEVSDSLNVLGGFFLEEGDFLLVSDDPKVLTFSGRSTIVILERAILGPEALSSFAGPNDIIDGYWRWGSDTYGGVMRRAIYEANEQTPPGLAMFDTNLIGSDSVKWDDAEDSNGVAWPAFAGEYRTQCGTTLLELYRELYGYGVELEIDARTFDIYAYNPDGYGTDRTSATFATGKVRFVAGVNIAADLSRQIRGTLRRTHLLVRTTDWPQGGWIESDDYSPGDPVYKGVYQTGDISGDPSTSTVIDSRAQRNMDLRALSEDAVRIPLHEPGDDEANGRYTPGPNYTPGPTATTGHFWTGDLITLDTGDHTMDYQDASKRVEAVEYVLREAGDWQAIVHLGPRAWLSNSSIPPLAGAGSHTLPIELCDPFVEGSPGETELLHLHWEDGLQESITGYDGTVNWPGDDGAVSANAGSDGVSGFVNFKLAITEDGSPRVACTPGDDLRFEFDTRYGGGMNLRYYNTLHAQVGSTETMSIHTEGNVWIARSWDSTVPVGAAYWKIEANGAGHYDHMRVTLVGEGVAEENPYNGVSPKAARCDHSHPSTEHDHDTDYAPLGHGHVIGNLADVDIDPLADGDVLVYDSTTETWIATAPADASAHIADATDAHDASAISFDSTGLTNTSATELQTAVEDLDAAIAGGGISATIVDAKGDLIVGTAADTVDNLTVGANGSTIVAASGETTGLKWRLNNDAASAAPTINDDSGDGYSVGSRWLDTTNDKEYVCLDATATAAVWKETTAAGGGSLSHTYVGYNTVGGSLVGVTTRRHYLKQITLASAGFLASIEAYISGQDPNNHDVKFGVWADDAGVPSHLLAAGGVNAGAEGDGIYIQESTSADGDPRWFGAAIGRWLPAGTYWIGMRVTTGTINLYYDTGGADRIWTATVVDITEGAPGIWAITDSTNRYSIRGSILS